MRNNIFGILLFISLVTPIATTFIFFQFQKKQIKREVKWRIIAGINKDELVLLKFTEKEKKTQLNWKHAKEFEYNGEMYDIVETEVNDDTTSYWCWWDYEETKLNKHLKELVSFACGNNAKNQENQRRLFKFFKSLYILNPAGEIKFNVAVNLVQNFIFQQILLKISNAPLVPPPENNKKSI